MAIRKCTEADADAVAGVCVRACVDDPLLGDLLNPRRREYPEDFLAYFQRRFLKKIRNTASHHLVTVEVNDGQETITGYGEWARRHAGDGNQILSEVPTTAEPVNRAADPRNADIFERAHPFTSHYWTGARADHWSLDLLVIDPSHWRRGHGRELVRYGLKLATEDGVCASLIASEAGDPLYLSCGFKPVGWCQEGEGNPLKGLPGGRILFFDPVSA